MDEEKPTKEEIRKDIQDLIFEPKKCCEIILRISDLLKENNCNDVERRYILSMLESLESNNIILSIINKHNEL